MITENLKALMTYRLEQADESLEAAKTLLEQRIVRRIGPAKGAIGKL